MKSITILFTSVLLSSVFLHAQEESVKTDTVETIAEFRNTFRYQDFYLSGQPTYEALQWLKSQGVSKIINLRSEKENNEYAAGSFNEESVSRQLGFVYYSLPVDGLKDYTPEKLDEFTGLLEGGGKTLIHCAGAVRVTYFFMAWLVKTQGYTLNEAAVIGRKLTFNLPIEKLLGTEISMSM
ncbi:MAG: dual specificity protein phosphatase family protein [Bacteroidales bacterium]|nr:dual specificity protein phosphatase family protein [Bacteroidales bacterium]